jgi:uncharacterized protein
MRLIPLRRVLAVAVLAAAAPLLSVADSGSETTEVLAWRQQRLASLTSDSGWLTLAGLFWLNPGSNSFGSDPGNNLVLKNSALAATAGSFELAGGTVTFRSRADGGVTLDGQRFDSVALRSDASGEPTTLASGALRFFVIERAGKLAVRVRDLNNPRRLEFRGLEYFPISSDWAVSARFVPYPPGKRIRIVNILGMEEDDVSPGAVVFSRDGHTFRLDTVLEAPEETQLFIMFADATSGHETYGGGRFLYIPRPTGSTVTVDFNKAFNPPCALNDFATCPLPPSQNRLQLRVSAGELAYAGGPAHAH